MDFAEAAKLIYSDEPEEKVIRTPYTRVIVSKMAYLTGVPERFFHDRDADDKDVPVLENVINASTGFRRFTTDENQILTTNEFVLLITEGKVDQLFNIREEKVFTYSDHSTLKSVEDNVEMNDLWGSVKVSPKTTAQSNPEKAKSFPEKTLRAPSANAKTIRQLWKSDYKLMVVKNSVTGDTMMILGDNGVMDVDYRGQIMGKYTKPSFNGKYSYSPKKYVVWDADKPIWLLLKAKESDESVLRRTIAPVADASTLVDIMNESDDDEIIVRCEENQKCYVIRILHEQLWYGKETSFNSFEIDVDTGELKDGTQNGFIAPRRRVQIWRRIK